jgi:methionine synthase II (cobalamin-independent)
MMEDFVNYTNEYAKNYYNTNQNINNDTIQDGSLNYSDMDEDFNEYLSDLDNENEHQRKRRNRGNTPIKMNCGSSLQFK